MRKIMFIVARAALLVTPAIALAAPLAGPLPIDKVSREIITINHLGEAHGGKHMRTGHIRVYPGPRRTPGVDGYASYPSGSRPGSGFVAPGDPGNPNLNSDFDRAVQQNQYNGR
jgi:hypothetical protein